MVAGNKGEGGPFAPLVVVIRNAMGTKEFNQLRGKAISLHSQGECMQLQADVGMHLLREWAGPAAPGSARPGGGTRGREGCARGFSGQPCRQAHRWGRPLCPH